MDEKGFVIIYLMGGFGTLVYDDASKTVVVDQNKTKFKWGIECPFDFTKNWFLLSHDGKYLFVDPETRQLRLSPSEDKNSVLSIEYSSNTLHVNTKKGWNVLWIDKASKTLYDDQDNFNNRCIVVLENDSIKNFLI